MKKTLIAMMVVLVGFLIVQGCEKKKPFKPDLTKPGYYFPINFQYKWTYVRLNALCEVSDDSFYIAAKDRNTRPQGSGWDLESAAGGITFVYQKGDTIFTLDINGSPEPFRQLVGPIQAGTFWRDVLRGWDYHITGFEDIYSPAAGGVYRGCARIRRTSSEDPKTTDFWWAPQIGLVKQTETGLDGKCVSGQELRRLDKSPDFP
jgi:hypothetical protein